MDQKIIDSVKAAGFRVYMRDPKDTWLYYTTQDGLNIGYLQSNRINGIGISTAHIPNNDSGTGYSIERQYTGPLSKDVLERAFVRQPDWANGRKPPTKWASWDAFVQSSTFNAPYREV